MGAVCQEFCFRPLLENEGAAVDAATTIVSSRDDGALSDLGDSSGENWIC